MDSKPSQRPSSSTASSTPDSPRDGTIHDLDVQKIRSDLDRIDHELIRLLADRRRLSGITAATKVEHHLPLRDSRREQELLIDRMRVARDQGVEPQLVNRIFHEIIDDSVRLQQGYVQRRSNTQPDARVVQVAFHGVEGSYSHLAANQHFSRSGDQAIFRSCLSYREAIGLLESGQVDYAVVPIENTLSGAVSEVYDLLLHHSLALVGEEKLAIDHSLVGISNQKPEELRRIYCRPQTLIECDRFLSTIPQVELHYLPDSGLALQRLRQDANPHHAAIASEASARAAGMAVLQSSIADRADIATRYVVLSRKAERVDPRIGSKTSLIMATSHEPGSLVQALQVFQSYAINLTKLESRPMPDNPWEQLFYVDFAGNAEDTHVTQALHDLSRHTRFIKILGCYPSWDLPRTEVPNDAISSVPSSAHSSVSEEKVAPSSTPSKPASSDKGIDKRGYKLVTREHHPADTVIEVKGVRIGGDGFVVMAGPCSVESPEQIMQCAQHAREHGAVVLRGGCFKPRSSPYSFQGLGLHGLDLLAQAGANYHLPIITEVMSIEDIDAVAVQADILQIGARNMQNFSLLKAIGQSRRPIMLKRGLSSSIEELLQAAEYILAQGNHQVMLCERGIRTFETATRNTLDLSAVPVLRRRTHLPIIVDPSHAAGERDLVPPLSLAAKAVGAHGIIVEFHPEPEKALSDGPQALRFPQFAKMMADLTRI